MFSLPYPSFLPDPNPPRRKINPKDDPVFTQYTSPLAVSQPLHHNRKRPDRTLPNISFTLKFAFPLPSHPLLHQFDDLRFFRAV
jgi:hypothetical protein